MKHKNQSNSSISTGAQEGKNDVGLKKYTWMMTISRICTLTPLRVETPKVETPKLCMG